MFVHTGHHSQKNTKNVLMPQRHVDLHIVPQNLLPTEMAQKLLEEAVATRTFASILKKRVTLQQHIWV